MHQGKVKYEWYKKNRDFEQNAAKEKENKCLVIHNAQSQNAIASINNTQPLQMEAELTGS